MAHRVKAEKYRPLNEHAKMHILTSEERWRLEAHTAHWLDLCTVAEHLERMAGLTEETE
jgi:hypothetical protein